MVRYAAPNVAASSFSSVDPTMATISGKVVEAGAGSRRWVASGFSTSSGCGTVAATATSTDVSSSESVEMTLRVLPQPNESMFQTA